MMNDWLPTDWKVDVKVRKNGKKDKFYTEPFTGHKFFSKPEVLRYLNNKNNNRESQKTEKIDIEGSDKTNANVYVTDNLFISTNQSQAEKRAMEELPPGWIKKTKITNPSGRIRKDSYYIDPMDGYIFRSKKEALRYIQTREHRSRFVKPKDKDKNKGMINDDKASVGQIAECESSRQILNRNGNFKLSEVVEDDQTIESTCTEVGRSLAEHIENPCIAANKNFNQTVAENHWVTKLSSETKQGIICSSDQKPLNFPKPASKLLPWMIIDSMKDLSDKTRTDKVSIGHVKCEKGGTNDNPLGSTAKKIKSEPIKIDEDHLLKDPCIEFAVKTLRGEIPIEDLNMYFGSKRETPASSLHVQTVNKGIPGGSKHS